MYASGDTVAGVDWAQPRHLRIPAVVRALRETPDGRAIRNSIPFRYAWPAEFDLMAQLAGMTLRERWSGLWAKYGSFRPTFTQSCRRSGANRSAFMPWPITCGCSNETGSRWAL